jgi:phospholipid/cholesterol/gamma-HCH transport system substrate-binding protein
MENNARYMSVGSAVLAIIVAAFGFVYWLNNNVGLGAHKLYTVRFEDSVSGLQVGAAVQFDGIRVGEVASLQLDKDDPRGIIATITVDSATPLRADTKVGIAFQGLLGTAAVSLSGGASNSPPLAGVQGEPAVLVADPAASQDLQQAARQILRRVDKMLAENSDGLKSTIDNLKDVTGALSRNSGRVDTIMAGLERLAGGGPAEKPKPMFDLAVPSLAAAVSPASKSQLAIPMPTSIIALQSQRMLARSPEGQLSPLGEAQWSDSLLNLLQAKLVQSLDGAGFLVGAASLSDQQVAANYQLLIDLRDFTIATSPDPTANIEFLAKLVDKDGHIVATRLFRATAPAKGTDAPQVAAAFDGAFAKAATDLVAWIAQAI